MVSNYENDDCSLRKIFIGSFIIIFGTLSLPIENFDSTALVENKTKTLFRHQHFTR